MTAIQLALKLCVLATNIALAAPDAQQRACAAQPQQMQTAYLRQAQFVLTQAGR
jgi:hypothetical protein